MTGNWKFNGKYNIFEETRWFLPTPKVAVRVNWDGVTLPSFEKWLAASKEKLLKAGCTKIDAEAELDDSDCYYEADRPRAIFYIVGLRDLTEAEKEEAATAKAKADYERIQQEKRTLKALQAKYGDTE